LGVKYYINNEQNKKEANSSEENDSKFIWIVPNPIINNININSNILILNIIFILILKHPESITPKF